MDEKATLQFISNNLKSNRIFSEVLTITPKVAEMMLNLNWKENRPLNASKLDTYQRAVKHGHWRLNGEPVIVTKDAIMIDGQHRLYAVLEAQKPITTVVTFGVESDVVRTIDCGRPRSLSFLSGISPAPAAALNFILRLAYGTTESTATNLVTLATVYQPTVEAIVSMANGHNMPILRQAPITAAAAIWSKAGEEEYVRGVYKALLALDSSLLPPVGKAFLQQCATASMGGKQKITGTDLFARAFKTFDPKQGLTRKLVIKEPAVATDQARHMVAKAMKHAGVTLDAAPVETRRVAKKVIKVR